MRKWLSIPTATLPALAVAMMILPVQTLAAGAISTAERSTGEATRVSGDALARVGQMQIGDRTFSLERVENGFAARDAATGQVFLVSEAQIAEYEIADAPADGEAPPYRVVIERTQIFGEEQAIAVQVDAQTDSSFSGAVFAGEDVIPVSYAAVETAQSAAATGAQRLSREAVVIIIVASAAAIGAIGCTILGWITNCIEDCAEACAATGQVMVSASEGPCGTCTCTCGPATAITPATPGTVTPTRSQSKSSLFLGS